MKKLLLAYLIFVPVSVMARMVPPTTICVDNGWESIYVQYPKSNLSRLSLASSIFKMCILPDGKAYSSSDLLDNKETQYKHLFDKYSGQSPTLKQIEKAKKKLRKSGYSIGDSK